MENLYNDLKDSFDQIDLVQNFGTVTGVSGLTLSCTGVENTVMGSQCYVEDLEGHRHAAEVVGYKDGEVLLMPFGAVEGFGPNCRVYVAQKGQNVVVNNAYLGRVINALGQPIDGKGMLKTTGELCHLKRKPPMPGQRQAVGEKLDVGVRALNTFVPICEGQRLGIFSGSGVGKSVLMSMIAKSSNADVNVIGLVGERGREVKEFIERNLGEEGLKRSVVVVATGDEPPLMRRQAAYMTMAVAEYFRDQGQKVMLFMDSVTRFAQAQREVGLSAGEPPTTKGFTPSVFSELPRLLERAGQSEEGQQGSITGIFTVLVEGGDMDEPVADSVRGIVDGHILLDRTLAERGHFPAIDVLKSVSRMLPDCHSDQQLQLMNRARGLLATYSDMEELIRLGAYAKGSDAKIDEAINYHDALEGFLRQGHKEATTIDQGFAALDALLASRKEA
ncbi:MAG: flagellum-specific ATP synthase FliI [Magnetococcales bacterium]|nr:flagellum-specific ATP synthase FliI [Magnetococcales bacterium]|tara:strand:- start:13512 stop:14849 length:1338 start_codon:yes stop_codon:yes gene_type:complete